MCVCVCVCVCVCGVVCVWYVCVCVWGGGEWGFAHQMAAVVLMVNNSPTPKMEPTTGPTKDCWPPSLSSDLAVCEAK